MYGQIATEPSDALLRPKTWQGRKVFTAVLLSMAVVAGVMTLSSGPHPQPKTMETRSVAQKVDSNIGSVHQTFVVGGVDFNSFAADPALLVKFQSVLFLQMANIVDTDVLPGVYPGYQPNSVIVSFLVKVGNSQSAKYKQCLLGLEGVAERDITQAIDTMFKADPCTVGKISTQFCAIADVGEERDAWKRCDQLQQGVVLRTIPQSFVPTSTCKYSDTVYQTFVVEGVDFNSFALDPVLLAKFQSVLSAKLASIVYTDVPPQVYPGYVANSVIVSFPVKVDITQIAQDKQCLLGLEVVAEHAITQAIDTSFKASPCTVGTKISTQFCAVADVGEERDALRRCDQIQQGVVTMIPSTAALTTCRTAGTTLV